MASTPATPTSRPSRLRRLLSPGFLVLQACCLLLLGAVVSQVGAQGGGTLSAPFERLVLAPAGPEAPFHLRFFSTAVKNDSQGRILTGPTSHQKSCGPRGQQRPGDQGHPRQDLAPVRPGHRGPVPPRASRAP